MAPLFFGNNSDVGLFEPVPWPDMGSPEKNLLSCPGRGDRERAEV